MEKEASKPKYKVNEAFHKYPYISAVVKRGNEYVSVNVLGDAVEVTIPATLVEPERKKKLEAVTEADLDYLYRQGHSDLLIKVS